MTRVLVALAMAVTVLVGGPVPRAAACSCVAPGSATDGLGEADAAFVGTYLGRDEPPPPPAGGPVLAGEPTHHHFSVEQAVKGNVGPRVSVWAATGGGMCGLSFAPGTRVGLLLDRQGERWTSGLCSVRDAEGLAAGPRSGGNDGLLLLGAAVALLAVTGGLARRGAGGAVG